MAGIILICLCGAIVCFGMVISRLLSKRWKNAVAPLVAFLILAWFPFYLIVDHGRVMRRVYQQHPTTGLSK